MSRRTQASKQTAERLSATRSIDRRRYARLPDVHTRDRHEWRLALRVALTLPHLPDDDELCGPSDGA